MYLNKVHKLVAVLRIHINMQLELCLTIEHVRKVRLQYRSKVKSSLLFFSTGWCLIKINIEKQLYCFQFRITFFRLQDLVKNYFREFEAILIVTDC